MYGRVKRFPVSEGQVFWPEVVGLVDNVINMKYYLYHSYSAKFGAMSCWHLKKLYYRMMKCYRHEAWKAVTIFSCREITVTVSTFNVN